MTNMKNEILEFLPVTGVASIVAGYIEPLTSSCVAVKRFNKRLQGAIKRILLKGIDKTVAKNNGLKIVVEICNSGKILLNITSQYHPIFLGQILNMNAKGDIEYDGSDEIEIIGCIYDHSIRKISNFIRKNIHFVLYLKYVKSIIDFRMQ